MKYYFSAPYSHIYFTLREKEILRNLANGLNPEDIAKTMQLHFHTVEYFINNMLKKVNCINCISLLNHAGVMQFLNVCFDKKLE